ncbi:sensor histidine kinase [Bacillus tuaregi]|uniref:sensor histidine kinase n=1 Tax=Bacillus tuaregi TaxID=1816695 RepID=UPI0008F84B21|nr:HAMP domain-containing sensor histidine kinase [Bacillus tuaregi]
MIRTNEFQSESLTIENNKTEFNHEHVADVKKQAAELVHEIRNPLTTIKGFLELLKPSFSELGKGEYAELALDELDRVNDLINQFLNEMKPSHVKKEYMALNQNLLHLIKLFESESKDKNIKLLTHFSEKEIHVYMDKNKLKQVLINLIKNAIEAIEEADNPAGSIDIQTEADEQHAFIHIVDNGCGMSSETINQLFRPFYTTKSMGTGIGLSVCKNIINHYHGNISIKTNQNTGSRITISLPLH